MRKEKKSGDQILWENFVIKNDIKKNSNGHSRNIEGLKKTQNFKINIIDPSPNSRVTSELFFENGNFKSIDNLTSPKINIGIEKNRLKRIKTGKINIERTLDLHGLSLLEAEKRLQIFIGESFHLEKRFLLIITGKGVNSKPNSYGKTKTIKNEIINWLSNDFYRDKVQYISKALEKHGGGGAYYVFLKKSKNIFS